MPDRTLSALLQAASVSERYGPLPSDPIGEISQDSRAVAAGGCFVAVPGLRVDGHDFLAAAIGAGAGAVVVQSDRRAKWEALLERNVIAVVEVPDSRVALADLSA
ncbi:MAG: Mur ligase domain-containing protein, partial [Dehalococcoidia bacterium]